MIDSPKDLSYFYWTVPHSGYRWLDVKIASANAVEESLLQLLPGLQELNEDVTEAHRRVLCTSMTIGNEYAGRSYFPLEETGLFRTFSDIECNEEGVLCFANRYGGLGRTASTYIGGETVAGESLETWTEEIREMRDLVSLWDLALSGDKKGLAEYIRWEAGRGVRYQKPGVAPDVIEDPSQIIKMPGLIPNLKSIASLHAPKQLARFNQSDVIKPAMDHIRKQLNKKMEEHKVTARMLWNRSETGLGLYIVPASLIGCLWLQFARAVDGDKRYVRCGDCGKWFEKTPHEGRANKKFCTETCKSSAHRKKKQQAYELSTTGLSVDEIARQLDAKPDRVAEWVRYQQFRLRNRRA